MNMKMEFFSGIHVKFKGEAHTEWYESKEEENSQGKTESSDTMHTGNEEYFQITYYVLGSNSGKNIMKCNIKLSRLLFKKI